MYTTCLAACLINYALISNPCSGREINHPTHAWKFELAEHRKHVEENRLWWGKNGDARYPRLKVFPKKESAGLVPVDIWNHEDSGTTDEGGAELKALFETAVFENPKPTKLLNRILQLSTNPGDLVLDSFAGSGTTGHAVLKLNAAIQEENPRRFILVEMEPDIARDITSERVRRVANGYTNAKGEPVTGLGGGFRYCELGEPLFDENGKIRETVTFGELARHVYFTETGEPLPHAHVTNSPFLGVCNGLGVYLLYNGILHDKRANGGNLLTRSVLQGLPQHDGPKVIYCAGCLLGRDRLQAEGIIVKQTPYEVKAS